MNYKEFCNLVRETLQEMAGESANVRLEEVIKNNNIVRQAAIIAEKGRNISPSIYLENYYADYLNGRNLSEVCLDIMVVHERYREGICFNSDEYCDYNEIKKKLYVKVINKDKNSEILKNVPWRECYDLAMIVYIVLEEGASGRATINVNNKNLSIWNIDSERLFEDAIANTKSSMPYKIEKLSSVMKEILYEKFQGYEGDDVEEALDKALEIIDESGNNRMYVLTNKCKTNGAMYIAFDDILKQVADHIEDDFFILPSSIHELLLVPKGCSVPRSELESMVKDINTTEVDPGEVLSDTVYEYCRVTGILWKK